MKLFPATTIRTIENKGFERQIYTSLELMNRAADVFVEWVLDRLDRTEPVCCICGLGNNGADGLVVGQKLTTRGFQVSFMIIRYSKRSSAEFDHHYGRLKKAYPQRIVELTPDEEIPSFSDLIVIDGIFGNGLNRPLQGRYANLVEQVNETARKIYAIDIPSGLPSDDLYFGPAIHASATLSFEFPKISFFFRENSPFLGQWSFNTIGLDDGEISAQPTKTFLIDRVMVRKMIKNPGEFAHKGNLGHVLLYAGGEGMVGAGILAAKAALKTGCGLCTVITSEPNRLAFQSYIPEVMVRVRDFDPTELRENNKLTLGAGPGIGLSRQALEILIEILKNSAKPLVLDADALNLISKNKELLDLIPHQSILTPHPKEFERLTGEVDNSKHRVEKARQICKKHNIILVVKGRFTSVVAPGGEVYYNRTGNPGMATAGSGDVLTGMITSLLAQGYRPIDAAIIAVYLHGRSGDHAMTSQGRESMIATDIINQIGTAFKEISEITSNDI